MRLSEKIKAYREKNNITQQELADKLFVSRSTVAKWEQGRGLPSNELLEKLSSELNIPLEELIDEKELRSLTIDNNNNIKEQKKSTKAIFIILLSVVLILSGIFAIVLYNLNEKEELHYAYCWATVDGETIKITSEVPSIYAFETEINRNDKIHCYDKIGNYRYLDSIQTGYKLYVTYVPSKLNFSNDGEIKRIDIVDDYVKGQPVIYGFFLSTEEYTGDKVPIYCPDLGYDYEEFYLDNNVWRKTEYKYPYYVVGTAKDVSLQNIDRSSWVLSKSNVRTRWKSIVTDQVVEEAKGIAVSVDSSVDTIYVYVIDNSEKGFRLFDVHERKDYGYTNHQEIKIDVIDWGCYQVADEVARKIRNVDFGVNFYNEFEPIVIVERNKNDEIVKETELYSMEQIGYHNRFFVTQDETRYVQVFKGEMNLGKLVVSESFTQKYPTKTGFLYEHTLKII